MELSKVVHEVEGEIKSCGNRNPIEDCVAISCASVRCQETIVSRVLWCGIHCGDFANCDGLRRDPAPSTVFTRG